MYAKVTAVFKMILPEIAVAVPVSYLAPLQSIDAAFPTIEASMVLQQSWKFPLSMLAALPAAAVLSVSPMCEALVP